MRELMGRVWDKRYKQYVKPYAICLDGRAISITEPNDDLETLDSERVIIEFNTGLKDKNGQKIYEGDIVLDCYDGDEAFIVEWDKDTASFILTDTEHILSVSFDNFYPDKYLEIIGNIHEDKELLETKNEPSGY